MLKPKAHAPLLVEFFKGRMEDKRNDAQTILKMHITIDGFVAGPNGEADWIFESQDEAATAWLLDTLRQAGVHIMGSRTFHDMAAYWPSSPGPLAAL